MRIILLIILFFIETAYAADYQCGLDTDHSGTITQCSNAVRGSFDNDRDGFTVADGDCDDTDPNIYPGRSTHTGCSANEAKQCPLSGTGTYTACSSGGWKPEKCTTPYYVDGATGNNANPGTVGSPWLNQLCFTSYYNVPDRPACYHDPVAGDCFVFRTGTYSTTYAYDAQGFVLFLRGKSGTSGSPIQAVAFPGEVVNIKTTDATRPALSILQGNYDWLIGLQVHDSLGIGYQTGNNGGINYASGTGGKIDGNLIYNIDGDQSGNLAGIHSNGNTNLQISNNQIYDVYDRTSLAGSGLTENNSAIVDFDSTNLRIARNQILNTTAGRSNCIKKKHSNTAILTRPEVDWNYCYKADGSDGYTYAASGSWYLHNNWCDGNVAGSSCASFRDYGGTTNFTQDSNIEYNDFMSGGLDYRPTKVYVGSTTFGNFTTRYNLVVDNRSSGNIISFCHDGPDSYFTDLIASGTINTGSNKLQYSTDCYYAPNLGSFSVDIFSQTSGASNYCDSGNTAGPLGATTTTFGAWAEPASINANPSVDSNGVPQTASCQVMGRFVIPPVAPTAVPTAAPGVKRKSQFSYSGRQAEL